MTETCHECCNIVEKLNKEYNELNTTYIKINDKYNELKDNYRKNIINTLLLKLKLYSETGADRFEIEDILNVDDYGIFNVIEYL